jgi:hypothetical protein
VRESGTTAMATDYDPYLVHSAETRLTLGSQAHAQVARGTTPPLEGWAQNEALTRSTRGAANARGRRHPPSSGRSGTSPAARRAAFGALPLNSAGSTGRRVRRRFEVLPSLAHTPRLP